MRLDQLGSVTQRFWARVDRAGQHDCWLWLRGTNAAGYGSFYVGPGELDSPVGKTELAHRVAYRLARGAWPDPFALHGCDNPPCCNPYSPLHVHAGDGAMNTQEKFQRGRQAAHLRSGERHSRAKFTDGQVRHIRERYARGDVYLREIAAEFGVSITCISLIIRRERYGNV